MTNDPHTINEAWREAMNRYDFDAIAECFAESCVHDDHGTGQRAEGRAAIHDAYAGFFKAVSELQVEQTAHFSDGDRYAGQWIMSGVHTGDLPGLPATGRTFSIVGSKIAEVRGGEVVHADLYWNMADLLGQLGALPLPPE